MEDGEGRRSSLSHIIGVQTTLTFKQSRAEPTKTLSLAQIEPRVLSDPSQTYHKEIILGDRLSLRPVRRARVGRGAPRVTFLVGVAVCATIVDGPPSRESLLYHDIYPPNFQGGAVGRRSTTTTPHSLP